MRCGISDLARMVSRSPLILHQATMTGADDTPIIYQITQNQDRPTGTTCHQIAANLPIPTEGHQTHRKQSSPIRPTNRPTADHAAKNTPQNTAIY